MKIQNIANLVKPVLLIAFLIITLRMVENKEDKLGDWHKSHNQAVG